MQVLISRYGISGSYIDEYEDDCVMGCGAV